MAHPSKVKGNTFEREIVRLFESYGIDCKRAWGANGQSFGMHEEVDCLVGNVVVLEGEARLS